MCMVLNTCNNKSPIVCGFYKKIHTYTNCVKGLSFDKKKYSNLHKGIWGCPNFVFTTEIIMEHFISIEKRSF